MSFVPAITKITSFSNCILSSAAPAKEIKLSSISLLLPSERFQTFIFEFCNMIFFISFINVNDENFSSLETPKCLTLNLPQPSSNQGFNFGPSTIIEDTAVPWTQSLGFLGIFGSTISSYSTHLLK